LSLRAARLLLFLVVASAAGAEIPLAERRSGYEDMGRETRAMQDDDATNPATLWVLDGESLWQRKEGAAARSCADCHRDAGESMKGVAARHPAFDAASGKLFNLEQRINGCRVERQQAKPFAYESRELLALTTYVARQSRGMPIAVESSKRTKAFLEAGRATFQRRQGQLNLACVQCHDERAGRRLAGTVIPQGHPTGYPIYRLEWQGVGSLHRRMRNCMAGIRAEPYALGAPEFVELEMFLMWRARGMPLESPGVRP
jgi:L-cysteine S-thiosulfotransferase